MTQEDDTKVKDIITADHKQQQQQGGKTYLMCSLQTFLKGFATHARGNSVMRYNERVKFDAKM